MLGGGGDIDYMQKNKIFKINKEERKEYLINSMWDYEFRKET